MGHVAEKSMNITTTPFNVFYGSFHMPLFMFLSGVFAYKSFKAWNVNEVMNFLLKKTLRILLPFLTFGGIYSTLFCGKMTDVYFGVNSGYWFLPALFYCMLFGLIVYGIINRIGKCNSSYRCMSIHFIFYIVLIALYYKGYLANIPYALHAVKMYPYFLMGTLFSKYSVFKEKIIKSNYLFTIAIGGYVLCLIFQKYMAIRLNYTGAFGIIILIYLFVNGNQYIPRKLSLVGKHSLEIYVLHWFFLPTLYTFGNYVINENTGVNQNFIILLCITLAIAIPIILVCMLLSKIIQRSRMLNAVCFGSFN